ncbi:FMN reductase [Microtetraspora sp. NBRC 13810]|uniref:NADPH-dependent FMN reductase n=1 Tax=Microtetraspora sp. NBRC 13810 TaxID=3030990 RepID=UPI0024A59341|nr:NAD(P)H-dependent oxidoreductase [Microtetraspora sp. NBRC 13810]GLW09414.1 FMN reductase [Microtetraspora sp. NBRC 13810]
MSEDRLRIAIIIGSIRTGRFGPTVANWFAAQACRHGELDVDVIDLAQTWLPDMMTDDGDTPPPVRDLAPWLAAADAFVIVTPEYNHSFPASLKNAIDWYGDVWKAKPVGFVCYGGRAAGLRAVEALKPVFTELHAVSVRETVSFHNYPQQFDANGQPTDPDACNAAAKNLLDQLIWWALALREARAKRPYGS